jgi:S-formylglutathione hydrolase FrmB
LLRVAIPGSISGFAGRYADVYLPPAALRPHPPRLPLLELLHGTPGSPSDWTGKGGLEQTLNMLASRESGAAPITVIPDINGAEKGDSECVRAGTADVEEYLVSDVPDWIAAHYPVSPNHRRWSIAGISEGGTCALMLALRHSQDFPLFGDLSGLARPTVGETDDPALTISSLFRGSRAEYNRHDPLWLLRHGSFRGMSGWFFYGARERVVGAAVRQVARLSHSAGIDTRTVVLPGGHAWPTWSAALQRFLPWLWPRLTA